MQIGGGTDGSNFIRAETHALLLNRLGRYYAARFLAGIATSCADSRD
ncbi:MAG: hypothetical protein ACR2PL_02060 [Dehalococcoidia bacterium]